MATGLTDVLQRLFESEFFDVWMCVLYLSKYSNNIEVSAYLCQKLGTFSSEEIENFLPQLCNVYLYSAIEPGGPLEIFLSQRCARSMHFALRLWWLLDAEVGDNKPATVQRAKKMRETAESCTINQQVPGQRKRSMLDATEESEVFRAACEKQRRCTYWETQLQFVTELCNLSYHIKTFPTKEARTQQLKQYLRRLNSQLWAKGRLCRRVYFPLGCHSDTPYELLLCIKPHEAMVLNSRERAPYLIILECIQSDCTCADPNLSYLGGPDADQGVTVTPSPAPAPGRSGGPPSEALPLQPTPSSPLSRPSSPLPPATGSSSSPASPTVPRATWGFAPSPFRSPPRTPPRSPVPTPGPPQALSFWPQDFKVNESRFAAYKESWAKKRERICKSSPNGHLKGWDIRSYIVKAGDDMRQEVLAMQLIRAFHAIWREAGLPVFIRPYEVIAISNDTGFIETVPDAVSLDSIKKALPSSTTTLLQYFCTVYGPPDTYAFKLAQRNFTESLVGYSLITYLLQIKDRHNGNILLTLKGHLVHIDFGFILSSSPGGMNFESAPFKLPAEYVELMGGQDSDMFHYFKVLMFTAFVQCRKHMERVVTLVRMMLPGDTLPCFAGDGQQAVRDLEARFNLTLPEPDLVVLIRDMIESSIDNWRTRQYDNFQYMTNGILP
eukprot:EG_transcript_5144